MSNASKKGRNEAKRAEKTAEKAERLAVKAVRKLNHLTGSKLSPQIEALVGELLGTGTNAGLGVLSGLGIPGVSAAAGIGSALSSWIGFYAQPDDNPRIVSAKVVDSRGVRAPALSVSARRSGQTLPLRRNITVCRDHFLLGSAHNGPAGGIAETAVPLAADAQLVPFSRSVPASDGLSLSTNRVYLGSLPSAAVSGDVLLSVPLDLLTGPLTSSKAAYDGAQFDLAMWLAAALIYLPTAAATTSGGLIALFSPDPTRTIASTPPAQRVAAAFQYGSDMLASNLWSTGMTMRLACDKERKYQQFTSAVDTDSALKLGGSGRVELICGESYSLPGSPGMVALDMELAFMADVPVLDRSGYSDAESALIMQDGVAAGPLLANAPIPTTLTGMESAAMFPMGLPGAGFNNYFDIINCTGPSKCSPGAVIGFDINSPQYKAGGLSNLGWKYDSYDSSTGRQTIAVPPGTWYFECEWACLKRTSGSVMAAGADAGSGAVVSDVRFESTRFGNVTFGQIDMFKCTIVAGAGGGRFWLTRSAGLPAPFASATIHMLHVRAGRLASANMSPLMDQFVLDLLLNQGPVGVAQATNVVTDVTEYDEEHSSLYLEQDELLRRIGQLRHLAPANAPELEDLAMAEKIINLSRQLKKKKNTE